MCWERPKELNLALEHTEQRKFWNISIQIYGGHLKSLLMQMADILYRLLMTSHEECGFTY